MIPIVSQFLEKKASLLGSAFYEDVFQQIKEGIDDGNLTIIDSPMEQLFFIEWKWREANNPYAGRHLALRPQHPVDGGKYILDFAVDLFDALVMRETCPGCWHHEEEIFKAIKFPMIGIEVDGHIWHEKSPEQVQKHKERERYLTAQGWRIFRFSGREVSRSPEKCVEEVMVFALPLAIALLKEINNFLKDLK